MHLIISLLTYLTLRLHCLFSDDAVGWILRVEGGERQVSSGEENQGTRRLRRLCQPAQPSLQESGQEGVRVHVDGCR